jgi:mannose-1-phosphate guanylyltransferase
LINNIGEFQNFLELAINVATEKNMLVTLGIEPTRAESSFGYIQITEKRYDLEHFYEKGVRYISNFAEKPDIATAQRFVDAGDFLWNSGIFVWKNSVFWKELEQHLPDVFATFSPLFDVRNQEEFTAGVQYAYQVTRGISIDYGILEKSKNVLVIPSTFGWSDVGTWDEVHRLSKKDVKNNVLEGDVVAINVSNCLVSTNGRLVSMVGVNDLIVIDTNDAVLICQRGDSSSVKDVVDFLHRKNIQQFL